ncbi:hypothetical protein DFH05DRAFT_1262434 [Lentinula detonsa]|uniref:Uncharacterized protein n=1 Tax=Lentinula detonsa TaxID=2804962 RepID=A0A9W8NXP5_9AGAR|nr:hypothetical protein DFH05DRAFT_1262434 [Lentinula detonsa]
MRFNIAYFVLGLASVAYAVPINSDGSASLPSLGARGSNEIVTFEFTTQHAVEANPNAISLSSLWGAKTQVSVKDPTAEKLAKEVVQDLFKTLGFTAQSKFCRENGSRIRCPLFRMGHPQWTNGQRRTNGNTLWEI